MTRTTDAAPRRAWTATDVLGCAFGLIGALGLVAMFATRQMTWPGLACGLALVVGGMYLVNSPVARQFVQDASAMAGQFAPMTGSAGMERAGRRDTDPVTVPEDVAARALAAEPMAAAVTRDRSRVDWQRAKAAQRERQPVRPKPKKKPSRAKPSTRRRES